MRSIRNFWPWEFQELEIYENPSWDLPGLRHPKPQARRKQVPKPAKGQARH